MAIQEQSAPASSTPPGWSSPYTWPPQQYRPPRRRSRAGKLVAAIVGGLFLLTLGAGGGFLAGWFLHPALQAQQGTGRYTAPHLPYNPPADGGTGSGSSDGSTGGATGSQAAAVAAKVDPALVDINTVLGYQGGRAAGTGIVLSPDGVVLTNNHVVAGATSISVTDVGNGKTYSAAVVGYDRTGDVAVLRLSGASGLTTATLADGSSVHVGDSVIAIGNAGGTGGTPSVAAGSVTALNQSITAQDESTGSAEQLTGLIEVNADVQAGDSGGPLVTTSGQVIGMDTAASAGFQYQAAGGDGFAIPVATATTIAKQIQAGQSSSRIHIGATGYLGIESTSSTGMQGVAGPVVLGVVAGSPAESAGLGRGDVIRSVAGTTVDSATALTNLLDRYHPGDKVKVTWIDVTGQSHSSTVRLATGPVG